MHSIYIPVQNCVSLSINNQIHATICSVLLHSATTHWGLNVLLTQFGRYIVATASALRFLLACIIVVS